jgi:hypothetical protein
MSIATIYNYILAYEEKQTNKIEVSDVWNRVRKTFWMYCRTTFIFFALAMCAYIVLIIPAALFAAVSAFFAPLAMLAMLCFMVYLLVGGSLTFMVRAYEKKGFFDALARSFKLVRSKWWSTFGIIFVLWFLMAIISYIFLIPWYIAIFATALHNTSTDMVEPPAWTWLSIVLFTLYYLASMILSAFPNIGIAFQYFNLVEMKEAKGLLGKIDTLGQVQPPSTADEQY